MKPFSRSCLTAALLALGLLDAPATTTPGSQPGKNSLTTRIDALLRPRLQPAALPLVLPNPFAIVRGSAERDDPAVVAGRDAAAVPPEAAPAPDLESLTDAELLDRAITRLRIGGIVEVGGLTKIILNATPYREGEIMTFEDKGRMLYLQVQRLTPTELTLGLRDVSQVIRLKGPVRAR